MTAKHLQKHLHQTAKHLQKHLHYLQNNLHGTNQNKIVLINEQWRFRQACVNTQRI